MVVEVGVVVVVEVGVVVVVAVGGAVSTQVVTLSPVSGSVVVVQPDVAVGVTVSFIMSFSRLPSCEKAAGASTNATINDNEVSNNNLLTNPPFQRVASYGDQSLQELYTTVQHEPRDVLQGLHTAGNGVRVCART